ncbi:F-box/LRR-repeat protein At3g26922 [Setaria italica]|uniref:F-box/LRR-repeat protein At3g26922 n=1 Tax=Setaria italica TaxID=4555 RepID=UPI0003508F51|nr:F-box/LRR-repeat protein At3g26922 [Setaria italica]
MDAVFNLSCSTRPTVTSTSTLAAAAGVGYDDGKDRISALPEDLLYDVVSRLPIRDAVHTTTLSNRWRDIWSSAPLVLFDQDIDIDPGPKRVSVVDSVLVSHRGPFRSVDLFSCDSKDHEPELARWTRILAERGVQDLVFIRPRVTVDMALPAAILRCDKLCRLHLGFWEFPDTTNLSNGVPNFPKLRELKVFGILMADGDLDRMLSSSPALEKLALDMSHRPPKHVRLLGQNLKCVISYDSHVGVRIVQGAPALKVLGYSDTRVHQLRFGDNDKVNKVASDDMMLLCAGWHECKPNVQGLQCQNLSNKGEFLCRSPDAAQFAQMLSQNRGFAHRVCCF